MISIINWIIDNWHQFALIGALILLFFASGNITRTLRGAKDGLKEVFTHLGFIVFAVIVYIAYQAYTSFIGRL